MVLLRGYARFYISYLPNHTLRSRMVRFISFIILQREIKIQFFEINARKRLKQVSLFLTSKRLMIYFIISLQKGVIHGTVSSTLKGVKVSCLYFLYIVTFFPFRGMRKMVAMVAILSSWKGFFFFFFLA